MTSGGSSGGDFRGQGRGGFLLDLEDCLARWRQALSGPARPTDAFSAVLRQASLDLSARARTVGFGGIGHHLQALLAHFEGGAPPATLHETLETVAHMAGQARMALSPAELAQMQRGPGGGEPAPPPLMTVGGRRGSIPAQPSPLPRGGPDSIRPPALINSGIVAHGGSPPPPAPVLGGGVSAPAALPALGQGPAVAPLPGLGQGPAAAPLGAPLAPAFGAPAGSAPPPFNPGGAPVPVAPQPGVFEVAPPPASRPGGAPNLFVRSMLGLRAFGKGGGPRPTSSAPAVEPQAPAAPPGLLGLASGRREVGHHSGAHHQSGAHHSGAHSGVSRPPPLLNRLPSGLPPLAPAAEGGAGHNSGSMPAARSKHQSGRMQELLGDISQGRETPHKRRGIRGRNLRDRHESGSWATGALIGLGVLIVLGGLATLVVVLTRPKVGDPTGPTASASVTSSAKLPELPTVKLTTDNEQLRSLVAQVHGRGKESPELRALVDENAALAARALGGKCSGAQCRELEVLRKRLFGNGPKRVLKKREASSPDKLRSSWLVGLKMPEIPVEDDPRVQRQFQFYTENTVGRETFQGMLFRCGSYKDMIQSTLVRYGLPTDLWAVVFAESSCEPRAQSPVGAAGLWQFIPSAARAYHLRVIENTVDERLNPPKATEAGVRYLRDVYEKLGSWDLVFASYNMGPFALMSRIEQAGGDVGFWDLVDAEMLPDETANYAPAIQAIALILNNVQRLKFSTQTRPPQLTSDLVVPPGTRLSMVARAAATSVAQLHALNLDIMGETTPNVADFAIQVPKDVVWQARDTLKDLLQRRDDGDLCAPAGFDWGRQRFTDEMADACRRRLATGTAAP